MEPDFSHINLEYLVLARDVARHNPQACAILLGISDELTELLANMSAAELSSIALIRPPLLAPRLELWWWSRLIQAAKGRDPEELQSVLEHAGLLLAP